MSETTLSTPLQYLKNVGQKRSKVFSEFGLLSVEDVLYYFPRKHLDRTTVTPISGVKRGQFSTIVGKVKTFGERKTKAGKIFQVKLSDDTGLLTLMWFNGVSYVRNLFAVNDKLAVYGKIDFYNGFQIIHPEYDKLNLIDDPLNTAGVVPLYALNKSFHRVGIEHRLIRRIIKSILKEIEDIPDFFSPKFLQKYGLITRKDALNLIHFANNIGDVERATNRLKFDEHFFLQLLMALRKESFARGGTKPLDKTGYHIKLIYDQLSFDLTDAQKRVLKEIRIDLGKPRIMNRLLQGDVGSGKTIVAVLASAIAVGNNAQVAVMAPTEILAHQHYKSFKHYSDLGQFSCALLTRNTKANEKTKIKLALKKGKIDLIIGTHALIQKGIHFNRLGLAIIDEQHRFGVMQRNELISRGLTPNILAMTATPIPRTLAVTYCGDMDISIIDELPKHRKKVVTRAITPDKLKSVYSFIATEVTEGKQCIVVYPLIKETEKSDIKSATEGHNLLAEKIFPGISIGLLHGKMKRENKALVMKKFADNEIKILVSTTVIEVGIDIPNATVMLVEHADRFGLTQLHQLRGRVGRGSKKSYCIFIQRNFSEISQKRLSILEHTNNGFKVSEEDLKMRGPGEFFGTKQSGFLKHKIADLVSDGTIIQSAREAAYELVDMDPHLRKSSIKELRSYFLKNFRPMLGNVNI